MEQVDGSIRISMETFTEKLLEKFWQGKVNHSYSPLGMDKLLDEDPPDKTTTLSEQLLATSFGR